MYESYTKQSLPTKKYRELLGSAICVFNSNTGFLIELLLNINPKLSWYSLIDENEQRFQQEVDKCFKNIDLSVADSYRELAKKRNRILHSFRITNEKNIQVLATKARSPENNQFEITEQYLLDFIRQNEKFSNLLYSHREKLDKTKENIG